MKLDKKYTLIISLLVIILIGITINISINQTVDNILYKCFLNDFPINMTLSGDFSGNLNCLDYYKENYLDKWNMRCSSSPFSSGMPCNELCTIDCSYQNKLNKYTTCVC